LLMIGAAVWLAIKATPEPAVSRRIGVIAVSPSGRLLASGTTEGHIRIWSLERSQLVREVREIDGPLNDLRFDPGEEYLAVANRNLTLVPVGRPGSTRVIRDDRANYGTVKFTSQGRSLVTINGTGAMVEIETGTGAIHAKVCCSTIYGEVALSPDDTLMIGAGHWPGVWDFHSGRLIGRLTAEREFMAFGPIAMDAGRGLVYLGSQDGRVHVWDLGTRRFVRASPPQWGYVSTISVLGESGWVAYAAQGGAVRVWNAETGEGREVEAARATSNLVFDGTRGRAALGTEEGQVEFWDLVGGRVLERVGSGRCD